MTTKCPNCGGQQHLEVIMRGDEPARGMRFVCPTCSQGDTMTQQITRIDKAIYMSLGFYIGWVAALIVIGVSR